MSETPAALVEWSLDGIRDLVKNDQFARADLCDAAMTCLLSGGIGDGSGNGAGTFRWRGRDLMLSDLMRASGKTWVRGAYVIAARGSYRWRARDHLAERSISDPQMGYGWRPVAYLTAQRVYPESERWRVLMEADRYREPPPPGRDYRRVPHGAAKDLIDPELGDLVLRCRVALGEGGRQQSMAWLADVLGASSWQMVNRWERGKARIAEGVWPVLVDMLTHRGGANARLCVEDIEAMVLEPQRRRDQAVRPERIAAAQAAMVSPKLQVPLTREQVAAAIGASMTEQLSRQRPEGRERDAQKTGEEHASASESPGKPKRH